MKINKLPAKPSIILLANDRVRLEIATYLNRERERLIALILHPNKNAKMTQEITNVFKFSTKTANWVPIFYADELREPKVLEKIKALKPDFAISAWFGYILKPEFLNIFPSGVMNFHNSYLPYNRGKYPHVWAIHTGSKYGITLHYIDPGIDTGAIIARREIKVLPTDIAGHLYDRSLEEIVELFKDTWPKFRANKIRPISQKGGVASHHFAREVAELDYIDLNKKYPGRELINQLRSRSFKDRSYAYFTDKGRKIYIKIALSEDSNLFK